MAIMNNMQDLYWKIRVGVLQNTINYPCCLVAAKKITAFPATAVCVLVCLCLCVCVCVSPSVYYTPFSISRFNFTIPPEISSSELRP